MPRPEELARIEHLIRELRGEKVILDSDLARLYGVSTKRLNEQVNVFQRILCFGLPPRKALS